MKLAEGLSGVCLLGGVDGKVEGGKGVGRFPRLGEQDAPPESFVAEVTYGSAKN